jgi:hypothetical protein
MTKTLRKFLIGSSVSIFPIIYLGLAYNRLLCENTKHLKIKYATLVMVLPFIYGLTYVILDNFLEEHIKSQQTRLFVLGAITGEFYSLIGHFGLRIPETLLMSKYPNSVHIMAPILYSGIYGIFVNMLEKNI